MHQSPSQQQVGILTGGQGEQELMGNSVAQTAMLKYQLPACKGSDKLAVPLHKIRAALWQLLSGLGPCPRLPCMQAWRSSVCMCTPATSVMPPRCDSCILTAGLCPQAAAACRTLSPVSPSLLTVPTPTLPDLPAVTIMWIMQPVSPQSTLQKHHQHAEQHPLPLQASALISSGWTHTPAMSSSALEMPPTWSCCCAMALKTWGPSIRGYCTRRTPSLPTLWSWPPAGWPARSRELAIEHVGVHGGWVVHAATLGLC